MFPNFFSPSVAHPYTDPLFISGGTSSLIMNENNHFQLFSRLRAWSSVVGGTLANAPSALEAGAYSLTSSFANNLRVYFSLTDGDILDSVTGNVLSGF